MYKKQQFQEEGKQKKHNDRQKNSRKSRFVSKRNKKQNNKTIESVN